MKKTNRRMRQVPLLNQKIRKNIQKEANQPKDQQVPSNPRNTYP